METVTSRINDVVKKMYPKDFQENRRRMPRVNLEGSKPVLIIALCGMLVMAFLLMFYYNGFVGLYTDVMTASAQIRTHLQKRGNITTNLTKMVVDYAEHEKAMYKYTADIRKEVVSRTDMLLDKARGIGVAGVDGGEFVKLEGLLSKFMAWSESYPDLKLNKNFQDFMREIVAVETSIADARINYNSKVNIYTTYRTKFPNRLFARAFGFETLKFYEGSREFQEFREVEF